MGQEGGFKMLLVLTALVWYSLALNYIYVSYTVTVLPMMVIVE